MTEWILAMLMSFWLGILTSISPCPLMTNIAAVSFIGRRVDRPAQALLTGLLYIVGRTATYVLLAIVLVKSLLGAPAVSYWLQTYMDKLLGPILILVAMFLLELIRLGALPGNGFLTQLAQKAGQRGGYFSAFLLGMLFALSFCPVSAAFFFGSLLPLMVKTQSIFAAPFLYGVGTAAPVVVFGGLLAFGGNRLARAFESVKAFEVWARRITGVLFLLVGLWFTLAYTLDLF